MKYSLAIPAILAGSTMTTPATALAGGMTLPIRGVHTVERAGAVIAGSEDADSLWLNPAGLAHLVGSTAFLIDAAYVNQFVDYARIDSGDNQLASVSNTYPGITVPTLVGALSLGDKLVVAAGVTAPYAGIHRYDSDAARYSSISLAESTFLMISAGVAYAATSKLRIGATVTNLFSKLESQVVLSGCPGQTICAPEDPEFDAYTKVSVLDAFSPSISLGVQYDVSEHVTLGAMALTPTWVSAHGKVETRLPSSGYFEGSKVVGDTMDVSFKLPPIVRFGIEAHPNEHLRIEAALAIEFWSMHKEMSLTTTDVRIEDGAGVGTYELSPLTIPRHYRNTFAPSVGGEYHMGKMQIGAGYSYETAAAPREYVSVLTVDCAKHIFGFGGGYDAHGWQIGGAIGFVKQSNVDLSLADARVPQLTPLRDQPSEVYVNAGHYKSSYVLAGIRFARRF